MPKFAPNCDSWETKTHFVYHIDLPGMERDEIRVESDGSTFTISGTRHDEPEELGLVRVSECPQGRFERTFRCPVPRDPKAIHASYHEGVLCVTVPREGAAPSGGKVPILVKGEGEQGFVAPSAWWDTLEAEDDEEGL